MSCSGSMNLIQRLTELDDVQDVRHRPSAYRIEQEVAVLMHEAQPEANQAARLATTAGPCGRAGSSP